jgi:putative ABC transport system permease protein
MIKNYFKVALRHFINGKIYSLMNVLGLAIGLAVSLLITLYLVQELRYDRFHTHATEIHRVASYLNMNGNERFINVTFPLLGEAMEEDFPEVVSHVVLSRTGRIILTQGEISFQEERVYYGSRQFFNVFSYPLLAGDRTTALEGPNKVVLNRELALKYFPGTTDFSQVLGQSLRVGNTDLTVSGVAEVPLTSHLQWDVMGSYETLDLSRDRSWNGMMVTTYIQVQPGADMVALSEKFTGLMERHIPNYHTFKERGVELNFFTTPLLDIHLYSNITLELEPGGSITYLYIFGVVALIVLALACVNFMNLITARSAGRAREVGIRKTMGSQRGALVGQFMVEAVLMVAVAMVLALALAEILRWPFSQVLGKQLPFDVLIEPLSMGMLVLFTLGLGVVAGSYPALYLSGFKPAEVLKGRLKTGGKNGRLRNGLVVFQFTISIVLIVCTLVVQQQLDFARSQRLGYDKENMVVVEVTQATEGREDFMKEVAQLAGVVQVSAASNHPVGFLEGRPFLKERETVEQYMLNYNRVTHDFIETMGHTVVEGRGFSRDFVSDTAAIVLNQTAARYLFDGDPIGRKLYAFTEEYTVIGVVEDFNYESFRTEVRPVALVLEPHGVNLMLVRLAPGWSSHHLAALEQLWKARFSHLPMHFTFLDEDYHALYAQETRLGNIFSLFTGLAVLIACMGLLGLAAFTTEQRHKEIGIRKVLGASVTQILFMLTYEFTRLVLWALLVALPVAWLLMNQWLDGFAYRIQISPWLLLVGAALSMGVAWVTVSIQTLRAAVANPVDAIKVE